MADGVTTAKDGDEDGDSVGNGEADRCAACEGIKCGCGAEILVDILA